MAAAPSTDSPTPYRRIILCFDGTNDKYDELNTNVVDFFGLLQKDGDQVCYYQPGIGTYESPSITSPIALWLAKLMDEAFAWYLDAHVMEGYQFIMQNYTNGDKIYIFGFSRGAYTARVLAGMLDKVGLLPKDNTEQVSFAYQMYTNTGEQSSSQAAGFKQTFCRDVKIEFMGVWETVESVGVVWSRSLPFTDSTTTIKTFRHALALDEHRVRFIPTLWDHTSPNSPSKSKPVRTHETTKYGTPGKGEVKPKKGFLQRLFKMSLEPTGASESVGIHASPPNQPNMTSGVTNSESSDGTMTDRSGILETVQGTDVLEVWFAGGHSDVGGGEVPDGTENSLNYITLRWMVRQAMVSGCGVLFEPNALSRLKITSNTALPVSSTVASQQELSLDSVDALQPIHDELLITKAWWILEILPLNWAPKENRMTVFGFHLGKARFVPGDKPNIHVTVKERMEDPTIKYTPRAKWSGTPNWVE